ncbi:MAG: hypothetical protein JXB10_04100 [Pirellulales bacterium]|nr:hypothetical protein [Pirellulales bacterium]
MLPGAKHTISAYDKMMRAIRCDLTVNRPAGVRGLLRAVLAAVALCAGVVGPTLADGFHNAALVTKSLDEWMKDVKQAIPDIDARLSGAQLQSGRDLKKLAKKAADTQQKKGPLSGAARNAGQIQSDLTPQQRALLGRKGRDCLEILAYMDPKNIIPREFPDFPLQKVPEYRTAAKQLLGVMGPEGTRQVLDRLREELMSTMQYRADCTPHANYYDDLLEILKQGVKRGDLTAEQMKDLLEATQGRKDLARAALAKKVKQVISMDSFDLDTLIEFATQSPDTQTRLQAMNKISQRAKQSEVLELLQTRLTVDNPGIQQKLEAELSRRSPKYGEVESQLDGIWKLAAADDPQVARLARRQMANAFQRAPLSHCLQWLGKEDRELSDLIWKQVDGRIARADADRRAQYGQVGLAVVERPQFNRGSRKAALELLARLKDRRNARELIELLPQLPRELWPKAGEVLRGLSDQDYGPRSGDGMAEVIAAQKQWQNWWLEQVKHGGGK